MSAKRGNKRHENGKSDTEKNTRLGGSDPTFSAFSRPKSSWGRSRPSRRKRDRVLSACTAGAATQDKRNYFSDGDLLISHRAE